MKTPKIIVGLLILLGVSTYATHGPVKGYTAPDYEGDYMEFESYNDLVDQHKEKDSKEKTRECKSYRFDNDPDQERHEYEDVPTIRVVGTPLPDWDVDLDNDGDTGGLGDIPVKVVDHCGSNPGKNFDQEKLKEAVECLLKMAGDIESITNWVGEQTGATWIANQEIRKETWHTTEDDDKWAGWELDSNKYAYTHYQDDTPNLKPEVWVHNIHMGNGAKLTNLPFRDVLLYWILHEFVHVLQAVHERDDGNYPCRPLKFTAFNRELEAILTVDKWWRAIFEFEPPYSIPDFVTEYLEKKERYNELYDKETLTEPEEKEMGELLEEMRGIEQTIPHPDPTKYYDRKIGKLKSKVAKNPNDPRPQNNNLVKRWTSPPWGSGDSLVFQYPPLEH
ncbi:MAG: hypothetical protein OXH84_06885 [Gammaproteobacteria bacterium]|nr:hypothetical protein [Gammaproteobacteria bacterium]